jgi:hypothetical protein
MAVTANSIITTQAVNSSQAVTTAAKTVLTDASNTVLLFTAGANGALVKACWALPRATITATVAYIFRSTDSGTTMTMASAALMAADTVSATDGPTKVDLGAMENAPWRLKPNERLYCAISVAWANGVAFTADGEDF